MSVSDLPRFTKSPIDGTPPRTKIEMAGIRFNSNVNLRELSVEYKAMFNVTSWIFVCGTNRNYEAYGEIFALESEEYIALIPPSLARMPFRGEDGGGQLGWPEALVQQNGLCFKVVAGSMLGFRIESNTVRVKGDGRGVLW